MSRKVLSGAEAQRYMDKLIMEALGEYVADVEEVVEESVDYVTREAVKQLRRTSPKKTGVYAKSWKASLDKKRTYVQGTVWNPKKYRIAHLLEKGHGPGERGWAVEAKPHIGEVEEWAAAQMMRRLERKL